VNVQSCVGYWVCIGMSSVGLCKSRDVEIVPDASGVFNMGGINTGGVGWKMGYIYSSSGDFLVQGSTCDLCWSTNTKRRSLHLPVPPGTS
jgi:hypothetical protein